MRSRCSSRTPNGRSRSTRTPSACRSAFEDEDSAAFNFENLIINLLRATAAPSLIEPAPVAASGVGSQLQLTIFVDDANAAFAELESRGVEFLNGPIDRPWGMRTACFADPDGHVWEIAQELG